MTDAIQGDGLTTQEIKQRGIKLIDGTRGGLELHAPTYAGMIATILQEKGFIEHKHINAACDYLELKSAVYGFLGAKTMAGILKTGDAGLKREHAEDAFYIATRHIGKSNDRIITMAMNELADDTLELIMVVNAYQGAFRAVFDGMDLAISAVKEMMQKELA